MSERKRVELLGDIRQREYLVKIAERLKYSPKFYTEEEIKNILNPNRGKIFYKIADIAKSNPEFSLGEIMEILKSWGWVKIYNRYYYSCIPNTYNYIFPILKNGRLVDIEEELVVDSYNAGKLQEYLCEKLEFTDEETRERFSAVFKEDNKIF